MGVSMSTAVWKHAPYSGGELLVLLAMADFADDEGLCWPSIPVIAQKARLEERHVYNVLRKLKADGTVSSKPGGGRGKRSYYWINPEAFPAAQPKHVARRSIPATEVPAVNPARITGFIEPPKPCTAVRVNPALQCRV